MQHDTTTGRIDNRTTQHEPRRADAASRWETSPASSLTLDRRTFVKAGTMLGLTGGMLAGGPTSVTGQAATFAWRKQAKLLASDGAVGDSLGWAVSFSNDGNTALVSAHDDGDNGEDAGAAYVFVRSGGTWSEQAKLLASDGSEGDQFGDVVALSGDGATALVGISDSNAYGDRPGAVYVFVRSGGMWSEQTKLTASDGRYADSFGTSVAIGDGGNTIIIGRPNAPNGNGGFPGAAYVFTRSGATWSEHRKLFPSDGMSSDSFGGEFGWAMSLNDTDDTLLVCAPSDDNGNGTSAGAAYVFVRSGGMWSEQTKLTASNGAERDRFGTAGTLSGDGDTALISSPDFSSFSGNGVAYVFTRAGETWGEQDHLTDGDGTGSDHFGKSVALDGDGDEALVGKLNACVAFTGAGGTWGQQQTLLAGDAADNNFGQSVALSDDGNTVLVGAPFDAANGNFAGAAYVFTWADAPMNQPPTAAFTYSPTDPEADEEVTFDASGSSDPDDSIASYEWVFGNGSTATGATVPHTFAAGGEYTVELTVIDGEGATATATQAISVSAAPVLTNPPQDIDGDGFYEDVNGDGKFNVVDVQALFANREAIAQRPDAAAFDFDENDTIDVVDVQRLFRMAID